MSPWEKKRKQGTVCTSPSEDEKELLSSGPRPLGYIRWERTGSSRRYCVIRASRENQGYFP